jgi:hypothetical protein
LGNTPLRRDPDHASSYLAVQALVTGHLLPAQEDDLLNIFSHLDQLFSLAFKNAMHDALYLCH